MSFSERNYNMIDPYNRLGHRNANNTNSFDYNCGGLALGTFSWYLPYSDEDRDSDFEDEILDELVNEGYNEDEIAEILTDRYVDYMLNDFQGRLFPINSLDEATADDTVILFRVGVVANEYDEYVDHDFHFKVRRDGEWLEKCGACGIDFTEPELTRGWVRDSDYFTYDGPIQMFIFKN